MKRVLLLAAAVLLSTAVVATAAEAKVVKLTGHTSQGYPAIVWLRDGKLDLVKLKWDVRCHRSHDLLGPAKTYWRNLPDGPIEQDGHTFTDSGTLRFNAPSHTHGFAHSKLSGTFDSPTKVSGKQRITMPLFNRKGKKVDVCTSTVHFSASG